MRRVRLKDLSEHDRKEVADFKRFVRAAKKTSVEAAYADIYGKVIFPRPATPKSGTEPSR